MNEFAFHQTYTLTCPSLDCSDPNQIIRYGKRGGVQRYQCKTCKRRFSLTGKAKHKQVPAWQVGAAVDMYYSGMSYKQIAENMEKVLDIPEPSKAAVYEWVNDYSNLAKMFMWGQVGEDGTRETATGKPIKAKVGKHWVADEMVVRVGGKKMWNWNVMDVDTRYVLASRISRGRGVNQARAVLRKALRHADRPPDSITTDGLPSYQEAIKSVLPKTKHIVSDGIYELINNNLSERLQGSFRQRTKTLRGLQTRQTAQDYLDGWVIDYNFFKDHHSLGGKTPAQVAGVADQVPWDEWEDVVRMGGEVAEYRVLNETISRSKSKSEPTASKFTLGETLGITPPSVEKKLAMVRQAVEEFQRNQVPPPRRTGATRAYVGSTAPGSGPSPKRSGRGGPRW